MKGKDITLNKGMVFDTFTDQDHVLKASAQPAAPMQTRPAVNAVSSGSASVAITSDVSGADIEVDGAFVGSTPTTLTLPSGQHQVSVSANGGHWQRNLLVNPGSTVTLHAQIRQAQPQRVLPAEVPS